MDNLGVFDRSRPLPTGGQLEQADGTAWMGFYCTSMLRIALELALHHNRAYEDVASKFLEHFIFISDSLNNLGGRGLWDDQDGFYYDQLLIDGRSTPLKLRALIGLIPLLAVQVLDEDVIRQDLPEFGKRAGWFLANRKGVIKRVADIETRGDEPHRHMLLSLPRPRPPGASPSIPARRTRVLIAIWRSVFVAGVQGSPVCIPLRRRWPRVPGRVRSRRHGLLGVRWELELAWAGVVPNQLPPDRGSARVPPLLRGYASGLNARPARVQFADLDGVAHELTERLGALFVPQEGRPRPCHGSFARYADDPHWRDYVLFYEYFDGDTGRGLGASHQTGWTALVASLFDYLPPQSNSSRLIDQR